MSDPKPPCWSCEGELATHWAEAPICPHCKKLQPVAKNNRFARLGLEFGFDVDEAQLEKNYLLLQQRLHPDRFAMASEQEKTFATSHAMTLNKAYQTAKVPILRAVYMLNMYGIDVMAQTNSLQDPDLLMEFMERQEALEEASGAALLAQVKELKAMIEGIIKELRMAFEAKDMEEAERLTIRLQFFNKFLTAAKQKSIELN